MALSTFRNRSKCGTVHRRTGEVCVRAARPPDPHYCVGSRLEIYSLKRKTEDVWIGVEGGQ